MTKPGPRAGGALACVVTALAAGAGHAAEPARGLPLPPAPVRVAVEDVAAFDAALSGAYRRALAGEPRDDDAVTAAWRRTPVGSKLEDQWSRLAGDLAWTWSEVRALEPRALGLAFFSAGSLEAVLALDVPLAAAVPLPAGTARTTSAGLPYALVARGAGDAVEGERRMGLAWARHGRFLLLATSERALLAALEEAGAGRSWAPALTGLVALELDVAALEKDRYFTREFLFGRTGEARVRAALRREGAMLVEVREGEGGEGAAAYSFDATGTRAAAWEPDGRTLWPALRAALLEPATDLPPRPRPPLGVLPPAAADAADDRYLVDMRRPPAGPGAPWEEGDLALWRELFARNTPTGWGYRVAADGARSVVFAWPEALMPDFARACQATLARRGGRLSEGASGEAHELRLGPGLPVLAWRRAGEMLWLGPSAAALATLPVLRREADLLRWARADLDALRQDGARWAAVEGPASPETVRPFADRILGVLGWMPETRTLSLERRRSASGWTERLVFGASGSP